MVFVRSVILATAVVAGIALTTSSQAQTSATLRVTARVVEECTVKTKRELIQLARKRNDPGLIRRCSKGVVSRVDQRRVNILNLRPRTPAPSSISKQRTSASTVNGQAEVILVTVTY